MRREAFADYCFEKWAEKYNYNPPWQKVDYIRLAKAAASIIRDPERAKKTWDVFLAETDPWYRGHLTSHFLTQLPRWVVAVARPAPIVPPTEADQLAARQALFAEVQADPAYTTEVDKRREYVRRAIERFQFDS